MRLWSLHPCYLDAKGLVALWREGLLARKALNGKTKGYTKHPQLERFRRTKDPVMAIDQYLSVVFIEAEKRGYCFNKKKIDWNLSNVKIFLTSGQLKYESEHLKKKLKKREPKKYIQFIKIGKIIPHPIFYIVKGDIEYWEKV